MPEIEYSLSNPLARADTARSEARPAKQAKGVYDAALEMGAELNTRPLAAVAPRGSGCNTPRTA